MTENNRKIKKMRRRKSSSGNQKNDATATYRKEMTKSHGSGELREIRPRWGRVSDCYQRIISRAAHVLTPRGRKDVNKGNDVKPLSNTDMAKPSLGPNTRQPGKDTYANRPLNEGEYRKDLYTAMKDLCKPRWRPDNVEYVPIQNNLNVDMNNITSVLVEMHNNEPHLSLTDLGNKSQILSNLLRRGNYSHAHISQKMNIQDIIYNRERFKTAEDADIARAIRQKTRFSKSQCAPSLIKCLSKTTRIVTAINATEAFEMSRDPLPDKIGKMTETAVLAPEGNMKQHEPMVLFRDSIPEKKDESLFITLSQQARIDENKNHQLRKAGWLQKRKEIIPVLYSPAMKIDTMKKKYYTDIASIDIFETADINARRPTDSLFRHIDVRREIIKPQPSTVQANRSEICILKTEAAKGLPTSYFAKLPIDRRVILCIEPMKGTPFGQTLRGQEQAMRTSSISFQVGLCENTLFVTRDVMQSLLKFVEGIQQKKSAFSLRHKPSALFQMVQYQPWELKTDVRINLCGKKEVFITSVPVRLLKDIIKTFNWSVRDVNFQAVLGGQAGLPKVHRITPTSRMVIKYRIKPKDKPHSKLFQTSTGQFGKKFPLEIAKRIQSSQNVEHVNHHYMKMSSQILMPESACICSIQIVEISKCIGTTSIHKRMYLSAEAGDDIDYMYQPFSEEAKKNVSKKPQHVPNEARTLSKEAKKNVSKKPQHVPNEARTLSDEAKKNLSQKSQVLYDEANSTSKKQQSLLGVPNDFLGQTSQTLSHEAINVLYDFSQTVSPDTKTKKYPSASDDSGENLVEITQSLPEETNGYLNDFQDFGKEVPDNLLDIDIHALDLKDIDVDSDEHGDWRLLVSGGSGDIYTGHLLSSGEKVILKMIQDTDFKKGLKEASIQSYLMADGFVPKILGLIGRPKNRDVIRVKRGKKANNCDMMIVQQFCAKGRTLYDIVESCLAESLTLFPKHWLQICYQISIHLENMHNKGVLHNDIKTENILVEFRPPHFKVYIIDFGQATFRKGGIWIPLVDPDEADDMDDYLAPEVCLGKRSSPQSDIYSLGVIFAELADEFCRCLRQLALDMCEKNPAHRPTLEEVAEQLEDFIMELE